MEMDRIYGKVLVYRERKSLETKITRSLKMEAAYSFEKSLSTYVLITDVETHTSENWKQPAVNT
jgi:predicted glycosyltransferase involved in capsule biosynthesis